MDSVISSAYAGSVAVKQSRFNVRVPLKADRALLFNSLTQALMLIEKPDTDWLDSMPDGFARPYSAALATFLSAGVLVESDIDEVARFGNNFDERRASPDFLAITIATTLACNLGCTYCFQGANKPSGNLDDATTKGVVKYLDTNIDGLTRLAVTWYGGEPLMNQRAIKDISKALRERCAEHDINYSSSIITNGYLLTPAVADMLVENGVTSAQITIDGVGETHDVMRPHISGRGSFSRIMANVRDVLAQSNLYLALRITLSEINKESVEQLLQLLDDDELKGTGRLSVYFAPVEAITSDCASAEAQSLKKAEYAKLEIDLIAKAVRLGLARLSPTMPLLSLCQALHPKSIVITPSGDVHKCWDTVQDPEKAVGRLASGDSTDFSQDRWLSWTPLKSSVCSSCRILPLCGGGCAFKSVHHGEASDEPGALPCPSIKFNLAERLFFTAKQAGLVNDNDWDVAVSPTVTADGVLKTGRRHDYASISELALAI
ncbi:MAG: radical SAM protein [Caulobacteraceae bacterium]